MASDSQLTAGPFRSEGQKIYKLNERCVWAASGEVALAQRVQEHIGLLPNDQPLANLRDQIAQVIKQSISELLQIDFRTQFFREPDQLLSLHPGDFIFAEYTPQPRILHITREGTPEWIEKRPYASGSGEPFAYALLGKYKCDALDLDRASVLAYKVIEEAIQVGAYGLGFPVDIWQVREQAVQLNKQQVLAIQDTVNVLRNAEIQLLMCMDRLVGGKPESSGETDKNQP